MSAVKIVIISCFITLILLGSCKSKPVCQNYWINVEDPSKFNEVYRSLKMANGRICLRDIFDINLRIYFCKSNIDNHVSLRYSILDSTSISYLSHKRNITINNITYNLSYYVLDDKSSYDEELVFIWSDSLYLIGFGSVYDKETWYKYKGCNLYENQIIDSLMEFALREFNYEGYDGNTE